MTFKKIVGFGDSWMWGDELVDPELKLTHPDAHPVWIENTDYRESKCFLGLLGQHFGVPVENFGIPGGSLQSSIWTYLWWLEHEQLDPADCLVLVALTDANRTSYYNPDHVSYSNDPPWNKFIHSAWVHSGYGSDDRRWTDLVKLNTVLTNCSELYKLNYQQTVLFFNGQSQNNTLQFGTAQPPVTMSTPSLLWPDSSLRQFVGHAPGPLLAKNGHPNELGHVVIRDQLLKQIEHVILA